jgi:hypothetical protein
MTAEYLHADTLTLVAGALLSLAFSYIPGLQAKYDSLPPAEKRLIMLGLLVLVTAGIFGLACSGWGGEFGVDLPCGRAGAVHLARMLVLAIMANQATFLISPPLKAARSPLGT